MQNQRASGYYWVIKSKTWIIACYNNRFSWWQLSGGDRYYSDSEFEEIDERQIIRESSIYL